MKWSDIKTTLAGYVTFLLALPSFVQALIDWSKHQPVDWRFVLVSSALAVTSWGLTKAKDSSSHSTQDQIDAATAAAAAKGQVKVADAVAENKDIHIGGV